MKAADGTDLICVRFGCCGREYFVEKPDPILGGEYDCPECGLISTIAPEKKREDKDG
jgi:hypothetical protein